MCITNHAIVAATTAAVTHALLPTWTATMYALAVVGAVLSHGLLDWIRHRDPAVNFGRLQAILTRFLLVRQRKRLRRFWWQSFWRFGRCDREARWGFTVLGIEAIGVGAGGLLLPYFVSRPPFWLTLVCVVLAIAPDVLEWVADGIRHRWAGPLARRIQWVHRCCHADVAAQPISHTHNIVVQVATALIAIVILVWLR